MCTAEFLLKVQRDMSAEAAQDEHGLVEAVLFPKTYKALDDPVKNPGPYLVIGGVAQDRNDVHLVVSQVIPFHQRSQPYGLVNH